MADDLSPPTGFVTIDQATNRSSNQFLVNIIGIITDRNVGTTRTGDFVLTFNVWDTTAQDIYGLKVRGFLKPDKTPELCKGDVIMLTQIKKNSNVQYGLTYMFNYGVSMAVVFPKASLPDPKRRADIARGVTRVTYKTAIGGPMHVKLPPLSEVQLYVFDLALRRSETSVTDYRFPSPAQTHAHSSNTLSRATSNLPSQGHQSSREMWPAIHGMPATTASISTVRNNERTSISAGTTKTNMKFRLLKDLRLDQYADLTVEIVKIFPRTHREGADLYATDYTSNSMLFDYLSPEEETALHGGDRDLQDYGIGPKKGWHGPLGQYTICVDVWPPHSNALIHNFREGDICFLKNVKTKISQENKLEARMSEDYISKDQINVRRLNHEHELVRRLFQRKDDYNRQQTVNPVPHKTRQQKKKVRRAHQAREEEERRALEENESRRLDDTNYLPKSLQNNEPESSPPLKLLSNQNIVASYPSQQYTSAADIINSPHLNAPLSPDSDPSTTPKSLPFTNARYRTLLRVIDFYPSTLADFSHCLSDPSYNPPTACDTSDNDVDTEYQTQTLSQHGRRNWEWAFALRVEDALPPTNPQPSNSQHKPAQFTLIVPPKSAEFLLKVTACDLRADKRALAELREKLFILWGDLEEIKREDGMEGAPTDYRPKNQPFEACVVEYATPDAYPESGWARQWALVETTIK
ncbi:hypothetical protein EJ05DRAFT_17047 [Pseudovirgaria hyperparasitica]|uniref:Protection of telomeres protein 1 ssDNA-binding domain-containing protein n=1 Tax=Pseudovirgaria hyperparasitica TaxID=470096 RepID=A0A6A6WKW6_9PEZI|nr:uncharacterized protein EJ05DRAFT_17047 [Pseudovirgaria hyperparasitica]KAF2762844.1 hypothetical protein EJ05DRAFT_17047 [Pseudovirgaria hyperparasitica]